MEEIANHSEEVVQETVDTPVETTQEPIETPETPATTQEDYFTVKYNKEERKISRDEAPEYIQKGLNYDKIKQQVDQLTPYQQHLEKVAKFSGYDSPDEFISALEQAERMQQIQQEASKLGVNEDVYKEHFEPFKEKLSTMEQELMIYKEKEAFRAIENEVNTLKSKYEDFGQIEDKVFDLAQEKGYNLEDAYKLLTYETRIDNVARQKEQEVLARVTGRDEKQVLASNDQPSNTNFDPANMSLDEIKALSKRAQMGERITF